jgi:lipoprotein-releasing system permease protein
MSQTDAIGAAEAGRSKSFEFLLAGRYLRARRQEGFVSIIAGFSLVGISLGVATLIIVLAVWNGFEKEFLNRLLGFNGHIVLQGANESIRDHEGVAMRIAALPGVEHAFPYIENTAMAQADSFVKGVAVRGMRLEDLQSFDLLAQNIKSGGLEDFEGGQSVLIGNRLAESANVGVGDSLRLISPKGDLTPFGVIPRMKDYRVAAIFEVGMYVFDSAYAVMPLKEAQLFFGVNEGVTHVEVKLDDPKDVECAQFDSSNCIRVQIEDVLNQRMYIRDWKRASAGFLNFIQTQRNVVSLILLLIIIVAALNIISGLTMLVKDKGQDIAILRTMGASRASILRVFLMSGASIGIAGALLGLVIGLAVSANIDVIRRVIIFLTGSDPFAADIYYLDRLPAQLDPMQTGLVVLFAIFVAFVATLIPAWRAARLHPVEALRND